MDGVRLTNDVLLLAAITESSHVCGTEYTYIYCSVRDLNMIF